MTTPWKLAHANYAHIKQADYQVAVLPCGATEPHNLHLPYAMDTLEGDLFGEHICRAANERGGKTILLPTIPYGTETNQREFPLSMNLNPSTLYAVITDLVDSLIQSGIRKIVILNNHGGNEFKPLLRELYGQKDAHLFLCFWPNVIRDVYHEIFEHREDHAGEAETSIALAYHPDLVAREPDGSLAADDGQVRSMRFKALNEGWVSITRPWHLLTTNSGSGCPHEATAEKGQRLVQEVVDRIAPFLVELSESVIDDRFPF